MIIRAWPRTHRLPSPDNPVIPVIIRVFYKPTTSTPIPETTINQWSQKLRGFIPVIREKQGSFQSSHFPFQIGLLK
jgi:hypothetical protein